MLLPVGKQYSIELLLTPVIQLAAQTYIDRYDYEHIPIAGAVDEHEAEGGVAFSLSVDRQVRPKPSAYKEQHEAGEAVPTDTTGEASRHSTGTPTKPICASFF